VSAVNSLRLALLLGLSCSCTQGRPPEPACLATCDDQLIAFGPGCKQTTVCVRNTCTTPLTIESLGSSAPLEGVYRVFERVPFQLEPEEKKLMVVAGPNPHTVTAWSLVVEGRSQSGPERLVLEGVHPAGFVSTSKEVVLARPTELLFALDTRDADGLVRDRMEQFLASAKNFPELRVSIAGRSGEVEQLFVPTRAGDSELILAKLRQLINEPQSLNWLDRLPSDASAFRAPPTVVAVSSFDQATPVAPVPSWAAGRITTYTVSKDCSEMAPAISATWPPDARRIVLCQGRPGGFADLLPSSHSSVGRVFLDERADLSSVRVLDPEGLEIPASVDGGIAPAWQPERQFGTPVIVLGAIGTWLITIRYEVELSCQ
jgi:hypothetical protein